jgi:hypothetical protein
MATVTIKQFGKSPLIIDVGISLALGIGFAVQTAIREAFNISSEIFFICDGEFSMVKTANGMYFDIDQVDEKTPDLILLETN